MKKNTPLSMFAFIMIFLFCDRAFSNDSKYEKSTFVEELIRQHQQIHEKIFYNYIKINAIEYPDPYIAVDSPEYHDKTPYSAEFKTIDELHIMTSKKTPITSNDTNTFSESIYCSNPSYSFTIRRETTDEEWIIDDLQNLKNAKSRGLYDDLRSCAYSFLDINTVPLASLLKSDNAEIESFEEKEIDGEIAIKMILLIKDPKINIDGFYVGYEKVDLLFLPEKYGYIPKEYTYIQKGDSRTVIYDQFHNVNNFMIPFESKSIVTLKTGESWTDGEGRNEYSQENFDKSEFYLSHYGLLEPDFGENRVNRLRYIVMIVGLVLIGIGAWRIYQKRREKLGA